MTPKTGQYVRVYFKNGMQLEGRIETWSDAKSSIVVHNGESTAIIMNTLEDIMLVQVFNQLEETKIGLREHMDKLEDQFQETYQAPSSDDLRLQKLANLRQLMQEQEKRIITEKMKDHTVSSIRQPEYGLMGVPGFFKKQTKQ